MSTQAIKTVCVLAVFAIQHGAAWAQEAPALPESVVPTHQEPSREDRLSALQPGTPEAYFTLGEEVAAEARSEEDFALARHLYVLTIVLGSKRDTGATLAASAAIALADLSRADSDRRALWSIGRMLDTPYGVRALSRAPAATLTD